MVYELFYVNKKQFFYIYTIPGIIFILKNLNLIWLFTFMGLIIEAQFYWNKFIKRQMKIIAEQKEEIETQAENLILANNEIKQQKNIIEKKKESITDSITYAKQIQKAIFGEYEFNFKNITENFVYLKPKDIVSGDFYWTKEFTDKVIIVAADCTGHGVPGAFMSLLGINMLNEIINENLIQNSININAGAHNPLILFQNNKLSKINADRMPVGVHLKEKSLTQQKEFISKTFDNWKGKNEQLDDVLVMGFKI